MVKIKPSFDKTKTLTELENDYWGEPEYHSSLVTRCHDLRNKPLNKFSVEDLRLLIGQNISLAYLIPMALEYLRENILAEGMYYPGDLLFSVLNIQPIFWKNNKELKHEIDQILKENPTLPEELIIVVNNL